MIIIYIALISSPFSTIFGGVRLVTPCTLYVIKIAGLRPLCPKVNLPLACIVMLVPFSALLNAVELESSGDHSLEDGNTRWDFFE